MSSRRDDHHATHHHGLRSGFHRHPSGGTGRPARRGIRPERGSLELQRRIVNGLTHKAAFETIAWLALCYAAVALAEQLLRLSLNIYRGWVAESTVRRLRDTG